MPGPFQTHSYCLHHVSRLHVSRREDIGSLVNARVNDVTMNLSEVPCRVSSDVHERRNDLGAVSTADSVKLKWR
jgi:hypothetical protein